MPLKDVAWASGLFWAIDDATVRKLVREAVTLNKKFGDPQDAAK